MKFQTDQEDFWAGPFGDEYIGRNEDKNLIAANIKLFSRILSRTTGIQSGIEFGSNIGLNLIALKQLLPDAELSAIEINNNAASVLKELGFIKVYNKSILDFQIDYQRDFVFTKGVLIHINPDWLDKTYDIIYNTSRKYICLAEYYNPVPQEITYRGHKDRLFKRDFAGELIDRYPDLQLIDYGFIYHRDSPLDDFTWFLMEREK
jgi:pseudaminic acid biosynthesis-associated methylase